MSSEPNGEPAGNEQSSVSAACGSAVPTERLAVNNSIEEQVWPPRQRVEKDRRKADAEQVPSEQILSVIFAFHCCDVPDRLRSGTRAGQRAHWPWRAGSDSDGFLRAIFARSIAGWLVSPQVLDALADANGLKDGVPSLRFETRSTA